MFIDAHAHLDQYGAELEPALDQIARLNILTVSTAMDPLSYSRVQAIAERCPLVVPAFGIHPWRATDFVERLAELDPLIDASPLLGELGLDYHWVEDPASYPAQRKVLSYFFDAARRSNKIVNLHTKGAEHDILRMLEEYDLRRVIIHWYSGPLDVLQALVERGAYFTVGVEVLVSPAIKEIASLVPLHLLLTETDNPGGQEWLTGEVGMPRLVEPVVRELAAIKALDAETMRVVLAENTRALLGDDPRLASWLELLPPPTHQAGA